MSEIESATPFREGSRNVIGAPQGHLFLSYSRNDRTECLAFKRLLEQEGFLVFRDEDSIRAGDRWMSRLEGALDNCAAFVVLIGRDGMTHWMEAELQIALYRHIAGQLPIFPVQLLPGERIHTLPAFLRNLQSVGWQAIEPLPRSLIEGIRQRAADVREERFEGCPFPGLSPFAAVDAPLFFGRRKEILEAIAGLGDQSESDPTAFVGRRSASYTRWLQIEGNSGVGKSSLVSAGLLPLLNDGVLWARTGLSACRVLGSLVPGPAPIANLANVIESALAAEGQPRDSLARYRQLQLDERALAMAIRDVGSPDEAFVLVVDQFEELFTIAAPEERSKFEALLGWALTDPHTPLFLITTVRADFLDRFESMGGLGDVYNTRCKRYFLRSISQTGLRETIDGPARLSGLDVDGVRELILADASDEPGALPLVQNALWNLWHRRRGNKLSAEDYQMQNGLAGMLSNAADGLLERIGQEIPQGRRGALELLFRLTRVNDQGRHTRQRLTRAEAVAVAGNGEQWVGERVIQMLAGERRVDATGPVAMTALRLITVTDDEQGEHHIDLIHETLIRARGKGADGKPIAYWPTLYDYVEANKDRELLRRQLESRTGRWQRARGAARLMRLAPFAALQLRAVRPFPRAPEGRFLRASFRLLGFMTVLFVVAIGYVGHLFYWTRMNDLPVEAMVLLQRFKLGYDPTPRLAPVSPGNVQLGEHDARFLAAQNEKARRFFGPPGVSVHVEGFDMGAYELTYDEYDYYVWRQQRAGRMSLRFPATGKGGRGRRPVVNVTWAESGAYAEWLGRVLGRRCRLPTEAEWEYAARGGAPYAAYWWGESVLPDRANCSGCGGADPEKTLPVGSFQANPFGLYDMLGNVWEWTCSGWSDRFGLTSREQSCAKPSEDISHVARGGSYRFNPTDSRLSSRRDFVATDNRPNIGFRVMCERAGGGG